MHFPRSDALLVASAWIACTFAYLAGGCVSPVGAQGEQWVFPLRIHVPSGAVGDGWIDEQVAEANTIFAPHAVRFVAHERVALEEGHSVLEDRRDRHALGAFLDPARIDVFVVRSLRDVDDPSLMRRGVHWRPAGRPGAHFVVVSQISGPTVLAHELGHYFGNPHSPTPGNIMSYDRGEVPPFFDDAQSRRIARSARRFARAGSPAALAP